jgi:glycolate oxidase iron-sulfur subunit
LPRPQTEAAGTRADPAAETALFVGCVATGYESHARAGLLRLLAATGIHASIPDGQTCCGTAALHAGDQEQAQALAAVNRSAFAGRARVLCLATGCQESLSSGLNGLAEVEDAITFLESRGNALQFRSALGRRVALHLPCTQRNSPRGDGPLRRLLARVPDLELIELPDTGCCGAAGMHMLDEPERADALRAPLLESLADSRAQELLSANIGCRLHLANASKLPIRHPIEFLAEQLA